MVVTKFFPAEDVLRLRELGVRGGGGEQGPGGRAEGRQGGRGAGDREPPVTPPVWHFVGQLQLNKAKRVVRYSASWGLTRWTGRRWSRPWARRCATTGRPYSRGGHPGAVRGARPHVLQVDLDPEASRTRPRGAHPDALPALADAVAGTEGLTLGGVMAVAPRDGIPQRPSEDCGHLPAAAASTPQARLSPRHERDLEAAVLGGGHARAHRIRRSAPARAGSVVTV
ncbi:hypothetical protein QJS66_05480 [Kocuria rhizophila]|nr:hypothetical protein QJS66_05480 [Kocuria rhizophila]